MICARCKRFILAPAVPIERARAAYGPRCAVLEGVLKRERRVRLFETLKPRRRKPRKSDGLQILLDL